ncbi:MAG: hypothetical protein K2M06_01425 [Muribaculaceae bacterium]|nr:hypothetical protein [Muribaculaceae bacterium]
MNKSLFTLLAACMFLTACSGDDPRTAPVAGEEATVSFTASLPASIDSRAYSDGTTATALSWAIYETGSKTPLLTGSETFSGLKATVSTTLVTGKTYDFVFWAQNPSAPYEFNAAAQTVTIDYSSAAFTANNEQLDGFYKAVSAYQVKGSVNETYTLTRPFAQVNIGTTDFTQATAAGIDVAASTVTIASYSTFDLMQGEVSGDATAEFKLNAMPGTEEAFPIAGCKYLAMVYVLMPEAKQTVDVTYNLSPDASEPVTFGGVPVQRNYRTNIYGALLTNPAIFNVEIKPDYAGTDLEYSVVATTPEEVTNALANPAVSEVEIPDGTTIDMTAVPTESLVNNSPKTITLGEGSEIQLGNGAHFTGNDDLTIRGTASASTVSRADGDITVVGGVITNVGEPKPDGSYKSLIHMNSGTLTIENMTLINDPDYHYHGSAANGEPYNSSAISYWNDANLVISNSRIISGMFCLCGMGITTATGTVTLTDSYFESTSSNTNNGKAWAYAMRLFGSKATLTNCEVKGIQGAVSPGSPIEVTIDGGKYYTINTPGKTDAFYALYVTGGATVTIIDGDFSTPNNRSSLAQGTSCVVCGDNDTSMEHGSIIIKGGKYSGKAYNHVTAKVYNPVAPLEYIPLADDAPYVWGIGTAAQ